MFNALAQQLNVTFEDEKLIRRALTHSSIPGKNHYERLEFLGDRVLNLAITEMLYKAFPEDDEGTLAKRYAALVRQETLAIIAEKWDIPKLLIMSAGEVRSGGREKPSILSDVVEAVLAVIFLEHGYEKAYTVVNTFWADALTELKGKNQKQLKDAKTHLQEYLQAKSDPLPKYEVVKEEGAAHQMQFTIKVITKQDGEAQATASSKQQAEQQAAQKLLEDLGER